MNTARQPTDLRQAELVAAALALAAERSPAGVTTAALAQAVGISQGAVFRHFPSKDAIWCAVIGRVQAELAARLQAAAARQPDALAALRAIFLAHVDFVVEHPGVPRILFQELQHPDDSPLKAQVRDLMQTYRQLLTQWLRSARDAGLLAPGTDLTAAAVLFIGALQGLVMQSLLSGEVAAMRRQAPAVCELLLAGLGARPAPADLTCQPAPRRRTARAVRPTPPETTV